MSWCAVAPFLAAMTAPVSDRPHHTTPKSIAEAVRSEPSAQLSDQIRWCPDQTASIASWLLASSFRGKWQIAQKVLASELRA
jgi:hypothetical protein